jgi:hypothetical protein
MITDPNLLDPRALLMQTLGQEPEQDAEAAAAQEDAETRDLGDMAKNYLRGFLKSASPAGQEPSAAEYDQRFRRNTSPARELLANILYGMSDSLTGQKFRTVQQRRFEQDIAVEQLRQQEAARQQQGQFAAMQVLQRELESRREVSMRRDLENIRQVGERQAARQKMVEFLMKYNVDVAQLHETQRKNDADEAWRAEQIRVSQKDPLLAYAFNEARAEFEANGQNPLTPENRTLVHDRAREIAEEIYQKRQAVAAANRPARGPRELRPRYITQKITNAWGNEEVGTINMDTGERGFSPPWWPKSTPPKAPTAEQRNKLDNSLGAVDALRMAINTIAKNPNDTVGPWQLLPLSMQSAFRDIRPGERNALVWFNKAISREILAMSGVATSGREEDRLMKGLPATFEKPANFVPGAMSLLAVLEAQVVRSQAGIDPNELDLADYWMQLQDFAQQRIKAGKTFKVPSAKQIIETVAKAKGKTLIYDDEGRVRGIR